MQTTRTATITADGTEGIGAGSVHAAAQMTVRPDDGGSLVEIRTDLAIAGRLAQFGRGIIDGVAKRMLNDMARCIREQLESPGSLIGPATARAARECLRDDPARPDRVGDRGPDGDGRCVPAEVLRRVARSSRRCAARP